MANKLFYKNEQKILIAYFKFKDYPCAKRIARHAGISRSTLHRHHKTAHDIPRDYEEYLFRVYARKMKKLLAKEDTNLKNIFLYFLVFITGNREIFKTLFQDERKNIIKKMLQFLKPQITTNWGTSSNSEQIFSIYENAILGVIEIWGEHCFSDDDLAIVLDDIMYLTRTARHNLLPLKNL